ncbi:histone-lysine N-methyltransferase SETDB2 isoform X2 [Ambystoma mexicanum]|uniref:histone-lysine N-methyltransferase SETDB2 isoform X2 n=1 Tax=Ambystoma mexicanum TaxID=8296 RepID=UPI0037E7B5FB
MKEINSNSLKMDIDINELSSDLSEQPDKNELSLQVEDDTLETAKNYWMMLEAEGKVDLIFEHMQKVLLSLKQKIKDGSATSEDYLKAMDLVNKADVSTTDPFESDDGEEDLQKNKLHLHTTQEDPYPEEISVLTSENRETPVPSPEAPIEDICSNKLSPVKRCFQSHCRCRTTCFSERSPFAFRGENILKIPVLCHFQRRHAKKTHHADLLDVYYQAPCGRSLRNFKEVQRYLFETKCCSLFVNYFSFNTYVQIDRTAPTREAFAQESDISGGAESVPVSFRNEIDCSKLPYFTYKKAPWPPAYYRDNFYSTFKDSCSCTDGCRDISLCACLQLTAKASGHIPGRSRSKDLPGYYYRRLHRSIPTGIFECSMSCKCDHLSCQNRVVQHGLQLRLQVFKTEDKGWGVCCLDDIDTGHILGRNGNLDDGTEDLVVDASLEDEEAVHVDLQILRKKPQIEASSSDSEIELIHSVAETNDGSVENSELPLQPADDANQLAMIKKYGYNPRSLRHPMIKRPKTKTAILQNRRKQLKRAAALKNLSSEEDSLPVKHPPKAKLTKMAVQEKSSNSDGEATDKDVGLVESGIVEIPQIKEKRQLVLETEQEKYERTTTLDSKSVIKYSPKPLANEPLMDATTVQMKICGEHLESSSQVRTISTCSLDNSVDEQDTYLLDATQEGNVGRFLNHSCCPNLFVQDVFVDTHDRNLPWVAFFTNRYVKAGTELTWDYNYEVGTMPENEIPCLCGVPKCRKRII